MIQKVFTIANELGIHARPAAQFVKTASKFKSSISISKDGHRVNGKSIMGLLTLEAGFGSKIIVDIDGEDEDEAAVALEDLVVKKKFLEA